MRSRIRTSAANIPAASISSKESVKEVINASFRTISPSSERQQRRTCLQMRAKKESKTKEWKDGMTQNSKMWLDRNMGLRKSPTKPTSSVNTFSKLLRMVSMAGSGSVQTEVRNLPLFLHFKN